MINQMGQVYANASLTIIDASGGDACVQRGLPGVSSRTRRPQACVYIRNTALLELPCGYDELRCSKWASRGWTYQEGYLSQRRLIFTPSQIVFLCNQSYAEESVCRFSQRVVTCDDMTRFSDIVGTDTRAVMQQEQVEMGRLVEYSKRHLTYSKDSLNAFLGILALRIDASRSTRQPIVHVSCGLLAQKGHGADLLRIYLDWYHETPAERRCEFPSWSWAGWGGPLSFSTAGRGFTLRNRGDDSQILPHLEWEISWGSTGNHRRVTLWEFFNDFCATSQKTDRLPLHHQPDYPKRLEVTCLVLPIRFQVVCGLSAESVPVLQFLKGVHIAAKAYLDQDTHLQDGIVGLIFAEEAMDLIQFGCILARKSSEGGYERMGAIPRLFFYTLAPLVEIIYPSIAFLDDTGSILDKVRVSRTQERLLFGGDGARRTISLV